VAAAAGRERSSGMVKLAVFLDLNQGRRQDLDASTDALYLRVSMAAIYCPKPLFFHFLAASVKI
jgi:hypothetical protein